MHNDNMDPHEKLNKYCRSAPSDIKKNVFPAHMSTLLGYAKGG